MRRPALIAALALGAGLLSPVPQASAGTTDGERCVTRAEYHQVQNGLTKKHVHRIFDSAGERYMREGRFEIRTYNPCSDRRFGWVTVNYIDGRVTSKRAHFG